MLRIACIVLVTLAALTPTEAKAGPLCDLFHKLIPFKGGMCGSSQSSGGCGLFRGGFSGICGSSAQPQRYGYSQGYSQPQYQPQMSCSNLQPQIISQFQPQQYATVVAPPVSLATYLCPCGTSCPCGGESRVGEAKVLPSYSAVVVGGVSTPRFTLSAGGCVGGTCITPTQATRVEYSPKVTLK